MKERKRARKLQKQNDQPNEEGVVERLSGFLHGQAKICLDNMSISLTKGSQVSQQYSVASAPS